ncbi:MAG: ABC transporter ATP-binding protein [Thaumarchaeota archaeon]|nr:ABC transporter ATP-binding protein [Nitrososphaerota archaeon]
MTGPSIEAVNLSKNYERFAAVSNLNLRLEGPKCVGFLGPNGAGKTTTLKIFTHLIKPTSGEAYINGQDITKNVRKALAHAGALIESPEIYPAFTPREALSEIAELRGIPRTERAKRVDEVIAEVRMAEWENKRVGKFSKGMKQRINIAAALLTDPEVILLDEPTTGLDPRGMTEVRDIVKSLKTRNKLIFMSSHLLSEVADVCDEVAMIDHGKLVKYDTLGNVTSQFSRGEGVVDITVSRDIDEVQVTAISAVDGVVSLEKLDPRNVRVRFRGGLDAQEKLLYDLVSKRIGMVSFKGSASALEDAYLNLIEDSR